MSHIFELIPQGKTLENIKSKGLIAKDDQRAISYKKMKKSIDEYHKYFIGLALSNVKLSKLQDFADLYFETNADKKKEDAYKKSLEKIQTDLRKEIVKGFKEGDAKEIFGKLNKKELFTELLEEWKQEKGDFYFDEEFTAESLRKVLSAITNREPFKGENKKESRFWNYNMWVTEDMEYTKAMISPLKQLNLSSILEELKDITDKEELEVVFTPMHVQEYVVKENKLLINFFMVKPGDFDDNTYISGKEIKEYIKEKIQENIESL